MKTKWSKQMTIKPERNFDIQTLCASFADRGLKYSKKRAVVIEYFVNADKHFTVEQLHMELKKKYPHLGYSTVYRTLKLLVECGVASVHHFGEEDARFELIHCAEHHDHFVCKQCGKIIEFKHNGIERLQRRVARAHGFTVDDHELQLFGVCTKCLQKKKTKKN